jgi:CRISPR-associated protein Csb1
LQQELQDAFKALLMGDAMPMAKLAPTSLVFGVWDSRDTQAKAPRLIASTIRAFNVRKLTRSAQYVPAVDYVQENLLEEPEDLKTEDGRIKTKHPFAQRGFSHVPATGTHGGVIAAGGIRRDATLHLAALRMWRTKNGADATLDLQRYLLGLGLVALTSQPSSYLRQGCNLVRKPETPRDMKVVFPDGRREDASSHTRNARAFAQQAAIKFGVEQPNERTVKFDPQKAIADLTESSDAPRKSRGRAKK